MTGVTNKSVVASSCSCIHDTCVLPCDTGCTFTDHVLSVHIIDLEESHACVLLVWLYKQAILCLQTLVPEAGDKQHNTCADGVSPGMSSEQVLPNNIPV